MFLLHVLCVSIYICHAFIKDLVSHRFHYLKEEQVLQDFLKSVIVWTNFLH